MANSFCSVFSSYAFRKRRRVKLRRPCSSLAKCSLYFFGAAGHRQRQERFATRVSTESRNSKIVDFTLFDKDDYFLRITTLRASCFPKLQLIMDEPRAQYCETSAGEKVMLRAHLGATVLYHFVYILFLLAFTIGF